MQPLSSTVLGARAVLAFGSLAVAILLLGPFQGAERLVMLTDKQAHGLAFFLFVVVTALAAPRVRRSDLVLVALAIAAASEIAQAVVGRDGNVADFLADGTGVMIAAGLGAVMRMLRAPSPRRRRGDRAGSPALEG